MNKSNFCSICGVKQVSANSYLWLRDRKIYYCDGFRCTREAEGRWEAWSGYVELPEALKPFEVKWNKEEEKRYVS